jgi:hypothetical protein
METTIGYSTPFQITVGSEGKWADKFLSLKFNRVIQEPAVVEMQCRQRVLLYVQRSLQPTINLQFCVNSFLFCSGLTMQEQWSVSRGDSF